MLRLATGQQMARFLRSKGVAVTTLTRAQIRNGKGGAELDGLTKAQRDAFLRDTPLWFYILREAELSGGKLRGVGARLVAETFHRAMEGSELSIVRDESFRPTLGRDSTLHDGRPAPLRREREEVGDRPARLSQEAGASPRPGP